MTEFEYRQKILSDIPGLDNNVQGRLFLEALVKMNTQVQLQTELLLAIKSLNANVSRLLDEKEQPKKEVLQKRGTKGPKDVSVAS